MSSFNWNIKSYYSFPLFSKQKDKCRENIAVIYLFLIVFMLAYPHVVPFSSIKINVQLRKQKIVLQQAIQK